MLVFQLFQNAPLQLPIHLPPDPLHRLLYVVERSRFGGNLLFEKTAIACYHLLNPSLSFRRTHRNLQCLPPATSPESSSARPPNASDRFAPPPPALIPIRTPSGCTKKVVWPPSKPSFR